MKRILAVIFLLFAINVSAGDLDSTEAVRAQVYSLLGMDTTGTDNLPTGTVDGYVTFAVNEINRELAIYMRDSLITTTAGTRNYLLDSVLGLIACFYVANDTMDAIVPIELVEVQGVVLDIVNESSQDRPTHCFLFADSVCFLPPPVNTDDTLWLFYNALTYEITDLSNEYRLGVLWYATYLAAKDVGVDATEFFGLYERFIADKKKEVIE